jgi:hypothetical protein
MFLASEALAYGRGGITIVHRISGASKNTIKRGIREYREGADIGTRVRACGGGRPLIEENLPEVVQRILEIVNPATYGNPQLSGKNVEVSTSTIRRQNRHYDTCLPVPFNGDGNKRA